jgi:hypothetical protein
MTTRSEVYAAIDGERTYQDSKWIPTEEHRHSITEWLVYIEDYVNEAKHVLSRKPDPEALPFALHTLRKIGAMAVAAMEQNGAATRDVEGPRPIGASA